MVYNMISVRDRDKALNAIVEFSCSSQASNIEVRQSTWNVDRRASFWLDEKLILSPLSKDQQKFNL